ncbi:hypothetical protein [Loigolactobacillus coryniformis]|uniref:hypothetical protein n=1 Tax=Loigolactobacillus coryniformis TaxID=1610 RepID=UPI001C5CEA84|nr:hypothetical protein [Loigolactobacillus coryniformis]MBW4801870.1 hypothetical protein [Loigolactobacillus coryniformis subsp. torquens]MBW4804585.1 hypothetical protein [Loigolactobacillus coryniformis subsp. torquens]
MHDDQIKENFKQDEQRSGAADSNMSYDEQNDNPMEPSEKEPKKTPDSVPNPNENNDQEESHLDQLLYDENKDSAHEDEDKGFISEELDHE